MCVSVCARARACGSAVKVCVLISAGFTLKIISNLRADKDIWTSLSATSMYVFQYTVSCVASGVAGYSSVILMILCDRVTNNSKKYAITRSTNTRCSTRVFLAILNFFGIRVYRVIHKSLRDFRTRLRNNQDRHGRKERINR